MIVDFVLGLVHSLGALVVGLLPDYNPMNALYVENLGAQGGDFQHGGEGIVTQMLVTVNYFLPIMEMVVMVGVFLGILAVWGGLRFVMRLIPGLS